MHGGGGDQSGGVGGDVCVDQAIHSQMVGPFQDVMYRRSEARRGRLGTR